MPSSQNGHKTLNLHHHHHHPNPNLVHPHSPPTDSTIIQISEDFAKSDDTLHSKIIKHRSLSPEKSTETPLRIARMNRYRASFRHGPNSLNTPSNNSSATSLTVYSNGNDGNPTPRRTRSYRPR